MGSKGLLEAQMRAASTPSFSGRRRLDEIKKSSSLIVSIGRRQALKVVMTTSLPRWATTTSPVSAKVFLSSSHICGFLNWLNIGFPNFQFKKFNTL